MRKIIGGVFQSLDGVIQSPGGSEDDRSDGFELGGWTWSFTDDTTSSVVRDYLLSEPYDLLLGRKIYDIFAPYWFSIHADNLIAARFNAAEKYVLTRRDDPLNWSNSHRLSGIDEVRQLRRTEGPDLLLQGSSTLYPQLLSAGLLDKLIILTHPILLGRGKRLFGEDTPAGAMRLVNSVVSSTGGVIATYEPAGEVITSSV